MNQMIKVQVSRLRVQRNRNTPKNFDGAGTEAPKETSGPREKYKLWNISLAA